MTVSTKPPTNHKTCSVCANAFMSKSSKAKYCSDTCRTIAYAPTALSIAKNNFDTYSYRADCKGVEMNLTLDQFLNFSHLKCSYCGDPLTKAGYDRIDNNKGYTLENTTPCCTPCNMMKYTMSLQAFFEKCQKIVTYQKANPFKEPS